MIVVMNVASVIPFCLLGSQTIASLDDIGTHCYQSNWYLLPVNDQRKIQMIITYTQRPQHIKGFGIIYCSLETVAKV